MADDNVPESDEQDCDIEMAHDNTVMQSHQDHKDTLALLATDRHQVVVPVLQGEVNYRVWRQMIELRLAHLGLYHLIIDTEMVDVVCTQPEQPQCSDLDWFLRRIYILDQNAHVESAVKDKYRAILQLLNSMSPQIQRALCMIDDPAQLFKATEQYCRSPNGSVLHDAWMHVLKVKLEKQSIRQLYEDLVFWQYVIGSAHDSFSNALLRCKLLSALPPDYDSFLQGYPIPVHVITDADNEELVSQLIEFEDQLQRSKDAYESTLLDLSLGIQHGFQPIWKSLSEDIDALEFEMPEKERLK